MKINPLALAGLAAVALTLGACNGKEPGEDSVATVDGYEITTAELNHELAQSGAQDMQDPAVRQAALEAIINRKLLASMAQENELDRTPDYILKEQRMRDVLLADAAVESLAPEGSRSKEEEVDAFIATNLSQGSARTVYAIEGLQFIRPRKSDVWDKLAASTSMAEIRGILESADIEAQGGNVAWDSASLPTDVVRRLNMLKEGEPFLIPDGNGVFAGVVLGTRSQPLEPRQARMIAEAAVGQQTMRKRVMDWLEQVRHTAKVQYGEGFGPEDAAEKPAAGAEASTTG